MQESERGKNNFLVKNGRRRRFFPSKLCCFISAQINWSENKKEVSCRNHYIIQLYTWISTDDQQMWFLRQIAWHISSWQNDVSIRLTAELFFVLASHWSANLSPNCYKYVSVCTTMSVHCKLKLQQLCFHNEILRQAKYESAWRFQISL